MTQLFNRAGTPCEPNAKIKDRPAYRYSTKCGRCGGLGWSEAWRHTGLTCYDCGGSGVGPARVEPLYTAEKLEKLNAAAAKRNAKKTEKRNAELAAEQAKVDRLLQIFFTQCPDVSRWLTDQAERNEFAGSLKSQLLRKGDLSEAQIAAVRRIIEAEKAKAASIFVGKVGERTVFDLTVDRVFDFQISRFPLIISYTNICHDDAGNVIVYRGSNRWEPGEKIRVKATIKEHADYHGVLQTVISRPKFIEE